jgi:hypothetical protein
MVAKLFEIFCPRLIILNLTALEMRFAINFYQQLCFCAAENNDEPVDWMLSPKFETELLSSQNTPKRCFRRSLRLSHFARVRKDDWMNTMSG